MITYFDTSALIPMLVSEPSSLFCRRLWDDADDVAASRLAYVEAAAAIAQAKRLGRLTERDRQAAFRRLGRFWVELDVIEVDDVVARRAADLADRLELRGHDAVHCASAELIAADDLVVASGDRKLLAACAAIGLATADPTVRE